MYLSEVTIKRHVSSILRKTKTKTSKRKKQRFFGNDTEFDTPKRCFLANDTEFDTPPVTISILAFIETVKMEVGIGA